MRSWQSPRELGGFMAVKRPIISESTNACPGTPNAAPAKDAADPPQSENRPCLFPAFQLYGSSWKGGRPKGHSSAATPDARLQGRLNARPTSWQVAELKGHTVKRTGVSICFFEREDHATASPLIWSKELICRTLIKRHGKLSPAILVAVQP